MNQTQKQNLKSVAEQQKQGANKIMVMTVYHLDRIKIARDELIKVKRLLIDIEQECELHMYDDTRLQSSMINSSLVLLQGVSESLSEIVYDNKDLVDDR
jgi:hypothetical protein